MSPRPARTAAGDPAGVREGNLARVVRAVLASDVPPTRADVAAATSMTRATVSRLVEDLLTGQVLTELDQVPERRPGRPGTPLAVSGARFVALGLQVNVGYLAAVVVDLTGRVVAERIVPADLRDSRPKAVFARVGRLAARVLGEVPDGRTLVGTGLALPGIVSTDSLTLLRAPNLGWSDVVVPPLVDAGPGGPGLAVGNEADLAAATVSLERPGRPGAVTDFVYLSGEIGIGGAVVYDGRPLPGRHGWAGELGHVTVDPSGATCPCGSTGCLELYAGKRALLEAARLGADALPDELADRVRAGDHAAGAAIDRAAWALGVALSTVLNVVDVPVVVLGGHLRELADLLGPRVEAVLADRVLSSHWVAPSVVAAQPHAAPGALGAAYRELERVVDDPSAWLGTPGVPQAL
jgi:predicted NBD/HSP70 family sugar kinase